MTAVFAVFMGLFMTAMPPALAPYRDAGEMTVSASTLGVSHPTGYPLYILLGRLAELIPLGNPAYRLTLFSCFCGAWAAALLFEICRRRWGSRAGWAAALMLGLNSTFWSVCLVPEMYALWMLQAVILLGLALAQRERPRDRRWLFFCLFYSLSLTNRPDLLLWAPGLLWLALEAGAQPRRESLGLWAFAAFLICPAVMTGLGANWPILVLVLATAVWLGWRRELSWFVKSMAWAGLGLLVYLYLPIRSAQGPWLDWNHPARLSNFIESVLRTRYGGTLDLLSKSYAAGELFGENMRVYGRHLWNGPGPGLILSLLGVAASVRSGRRLFLGFFALYWWSGPVFLFMANMPPNPHALAIVEPHYLLSDLVLALWAAQGLAALEANFPSRVVSWAIAAFLAVMPFGRGLWAQAARRDHFFSYDYAKNVLKSVPPRGVLVAKKDVQLYTLWHYQLLHGWRPDVRLVSQGLSHTPWYQAGWRLRNPNLSLGLLKDAGQWERFRDLNGSVFATYDAELPLPAGALMPQGLVIHLPRSSARAPSPAPDDYWPLFARRGLYRYEDQPDFFTSDLVETYAQAAYRTGVSRHGSGDIAAASRHLRHSWLMHWTLFDPAVFLGYIAYQKQDWSQARRYYGLSAGLCDGTLALTEAYRSLPDLKAAIRRACAESHMHLGVCHEKLGAPDRAEASYRVSLSLHPTAQAHYNMAVLFWNKDWGRVEEHLQEALRLDPSHPEASQYLARLRNRRPSP